MKEMCSFQRTNVKFGAFMITLSAMYYVMLYSMIDKLIHSLSLTHTHTHTQSTVLATHVHSFEDGRHRPQDLHLEEVHVYILWLAGPVWGAHQCPAHSTGAVWPHPPQRAGHEVQGILELSIINSTSVSDLCMYYACFIRDQNYSHALQFVKLLKGHPLLSFLLTFQCYMQHIYHWKSHWRYPHFMFRAFCSGLQFWSWRPLPFVAIVSMWQPLP